MHYLKFVLSPLIAAALGGIIYVKAVVFEPHQRSIATIEASVEMGSFSEPMFVEK